jgi:hypothetical protein
LVRHIPARDGKIVKLFLQCIALFNKYAKKSPDTVSLIDESRRTRIARRRRRRRGQDMLDRTISRPSWTGSTSEWTLPLFSIFNFISKRKLPL